MFVATFPEFQREVTGQQSILQLGTVTHQRRLLRMRKLPDPEDPEAVAVLGTAVLDLPESSTTLEGGGCPGSTICDPLLHHVRGHSNGDSSGSCATFVEVLCPNGTSLLERLPIAPTGIRSGGHASPSPRPLRNGSSSLSGTSAARAAMTSGDGRTTPHDDGDLHPTSPHQHNREGENSKKEVASDDAAMCSQDPVSVSAHTADAETSNQWADKGDGESIPSIYVSYGSCTLASRRRCARRRKSQPALTQISAAMRRDMSVLPSGSTELLSWNELNGLASAAEVPFEVFSPTSAPCTPLTVYEACDVSGRVLLTDRLIESQSNTALPLMIEAYKQYMHAASANTEYLPTASLESSRSTRRIGKLSEDEELAATLQVLAPRQQGIVLRARNTSEEVLKCVAQARRCARPSFRYIDPAEMYGTSSYCCRAPTPAHVTG
ncbi:hypothetical protein ABL78_3418 [Leptomonas seymouri]|uniref:Uncharacterized protein n=1 Tax=Leptomonas seymouri TaxID=5684 RepID=A0A0N0P6S5_LEPSE|nr:hypothetical protein ABL78_3418 [Leptomonas seymouri]|eukprot:KPI87507.1 hypothetical protein ABL78_3418 [Leptomonas seymouri]